MRSISLYSIILAFMIAPVSAIAAPQYGIAMHGEAKYNAPFDHLDYVNPDAPKGGRITFGHQGSFDSLNPFLLKGVAPRGVWDVEYGLNVYEPLLTRSADEAFSLYGLLAEWVDMPDDRSSITFKIRDEARFSDAHPVSVEDVKFTIDLLAEFGRPSYQSLIKRIKAIEEPGPGQIRFVFADGSDRELPLLIGKLPVLPAHAIDREKFSKSGMYRFIGSGPYLIDKVEPGTKIVLKRNPDYWGKDLPIKKGFDNFDEIAIEYFRDKTTMFEAFKKGEFDVLAESDPARWATQYTFPAVEKGDVVKQVFQSGLPKGMSAFVFNTRRAVFSNRNVRRALAQLFDFEWVNKNFYFGLFSRTGSYFQNSDLSSLSVPASPKERELLAPYLASIDEDILEGRYRPVSIGNAKDMRRLLAECIKVLSTEGYALKDGQMVEVSTGHPMRFEFLAMSKEEERLAMAYARVLSRIGIKLSIRSVDSAQFWERRKTMDFDMMQIFWSASLSPGNEQFSRWDSSMRDKDGWFNQAGANDPAVDAMIKALLAAKSGDDFVSAVRAFDRCLINGYYVVPLFHKKDQWVAMWNHLGFPGGEMKMPPLSGYRTDTWWAKEK